MFVPYPIRPEATLIPTEKIVTDVRETTLYGYQGSSAYKSSDWGANWTLIYSGFPSSIKQIKKLNSGRILAFLTNGTVQRSDENEANFSLVLITDKTFADNFGIKCYGDLILVGEYGSNVDDAWISRDGGATWDIMFTHPLGTQIAHIHDVAYDPYEGLIWVTTGDGSNFNNIFFSPDFGQTWEGLPPDIRLRVTQIIPLPDCVLFGLDEIWSQGYYRWNRPADGTTQHAFNPEVAFLPNKCWIESTIDALTWASQAAIIEGADTATYFGFVQWDRSIKMPNAVYCTRDGVKFYTIWQANALPTSGTGTRAVGVYGVYGPTTDGYLAVMLRDLDTYTILKLKVPEWVEV